MGIRLGDKAPNFTAQTTEGTINFYEWLGGDWALLISHPADFTPVCTTELGEVARMKSAFDARGVKVIGLSVDSLSDHKRWMNDIEKTHNVKLNFPLIADPSHEVADAYDMIHADGDIQVAGRCAFVIDNRKRVRLILNYPESTGRNFDEILRAIDSLKLTTDYGVMTPSNWRPGDDVIVLPSLSAAEARKRFPQGWEERTSYMRMVHDPSH